MTRLTIPNLRTFQFLLVTALLAIGCFPCQAGDPAATGRQKAAQAWVDDTRAQFHLPGFSVAVIHEGELVFSGQAGMADLELQVAVNENTRFRMGSLSKMLTIGLAAKLVQEGQLAWQEEAAKYVPQTPVKGRAPTIAELASHTSGIRHYLATDFQDCERTLKAVATDTLMYPTLTDGLSIFIADPLLFEPGSSYSYSSYGYNLLGVILEKAGKADFLTLMKEKLLDPLGMNHTCADLPYQLIPDRADGYNIGSDNHWQPAGFADSSYKWPSGGMIGTPTDLARLGLAFLQPGWLEAAALQAIFTPQRNALTKSYQVGLGWRIGSDEGGETMYFHGGAIEGGRAHILLIPRTRTVVVLMANAFARFGREESLSLAKIFSTSPKERP